MKQEFEFRLNVSVGGAIAFPSFDWVTNQLRALRQLWPLLLALVRLLA